MFVANCDILLFVIPTILSSTISLLKLTTVPPFSPNIYSMLIPNILHPKSPVLSTSTSKTQGSVDNISAITLTDLFGAEYRTASGCAKAYFDRPSCVAFEVSKMVISSASCSREYNCICAFNLKPRNLSIQPYQF